MAHRDPAFQWETEALRSSPQRRAPGPPGAMEGRNDAGWVTLRQAEIATGIPLGTLRRWAKLGNVPSRTQATGSGPRRIVWLEGVMARAEVLGRKKDIDAPPIDDDVVEFAASADAAVAEDDPVRQAPEPQRITPDAAPLPPERDAAGERPEAPEPPPGTMLVPVDAWNKMLAQLGNLHEAGQALAEARERAAKAETEAEFLRERLQEMRSEVNDARQEAQEARKGPEVAEPLLRFLRRFS